MWDEEGENKSLANISELQLGGKWIQELGKQAILSFVRIHTIFMGQNFLFCRKHLIFETRTEPDLTPVHDRI